MNRPSTSKPEPGDRVGIIWLLLSTAVVISVAMLLFVLTSCVRPPPPAIGPPALPPVTPISQCTEVFPTGGPAGFTRPVPTNHPITILPAVAGQRIIIWLDRHCDRFFLGPIDYTHGPTWCRYHPESGDRYYSNQDGFIDIIPRACPVE